MSIFQVQTLDGPAAASSSAGASPALAHSNWRVEHVVRSALRAPSSFTPFPGTGWRCAAAAGVARQLALRSRVLLARFLCPSPPVLRREHAASASRSRESCTLCGARNLLSLVQAAERLGERFTQLGGRPCHIRYSARPLPPPLTWPRFVSMGLHGLGSRSPL